jgi:uncharacterized protein (UPF0335 family)
VGKNSAWNICAEIKSLGGRVEELEAAKKQLEADVAGLKSAGELSKQQYDGKIAEYISLLNNKDAELNRLRKENGIFSKNSGFVEFFKLQNQNF